MVLVSDPEAIRRVFAAGPDVLHGGASSTVLEPFAGPTSILLTHGPEHLRRRRELLPAFHGERAGGWRGTIAALARRRGRDVAGRRAAAHAPAHAGADARRDPARRARPRASGPSCASAIRRALDMTASLPRLVAMSLAPRRHVERVPARRGGGRRLLLREIDRGGHAEGSLLGVLARGGHRPRRSCATRSSPCWRPATRRRPARSHGRSSGSRTIPRRRSGSARATRPTSTRSSRRCCACGPCSRSPPAAWRRRSRSPATMLPPGVHVAPCIYLAHRRPEAWPDPTAFRPERFLERRARAGHLPAVRRRRAPLRRRGVRRARAA